MKALIAVLIILLAVLVIIILAFLLVYQKNRVLETTNPTPAPPQNITAAPTTTNKTQYCNASDLDAAGVFQGAAGNIYATLSLKNVSKRECQISGDKFLNISYSAKNLTVKEQDKSGQNTIPLLPGQAVYSQIHYPNGPQCQGPVKMVDITVGYEITPGSTVTFKNQNGVTQQPVASCESISQMTQIDVWSIYNHPVNE